MHEFSIHTALAYEVATPSHFCFNFEVMRHPRHAIRSEALTVVQPQAGGAVPLEHYVDEHGNRFLRFDAQPGLLHLDYRANVGLEADPRPEFLPEVPVSRLPGDVLRYVMPSRFCESDLLARITAQTFGHVPMGATRVEAIVAWIRQNVEYQIGTTTATTSAKQVFLQRKGVCRDFAHLAITMCRALNIPARLVVGYAYFDEPPQDFHALFEVWLGDRWVMYDPTGLADARHLVRVGQGSDAKDVAFLTAFGQLRLCGMRIDLDERDVASGRRRRSMPEDPPVMAGPAPIEGVPAQPLQQPPEPEQTPMAPSPDPATAG